MLRRHQAELLALCEEIQQGQHSELQDILCSVTPGGGKSTLPLIAAARLIGEYADKLCWIVPRLSLQRQAEFEFLKTVFRRRLNHRHEVRQSTNDLDPSRGLSGYITTYQAVAQNPALHVHEFSRYRYIVVLDEPHHVEEGGAWERALAPVVEQATLRILMSGTLERANGRRIAFFPYRLRDGVEHLDLTPDSGTSVIRYSRAQALTERAIIPLFFRHFDARAEWMNGSGELRSAETLNSAGKEAAQALYTALSTRYAYQLLDAAVQDWQAHKRENPRSKLLVVAASTAAAREYVRHVKQAGIAADIATSLESEQALRNIERFRKVGTPDAVDVLVTVQMAYEGLDVPSITHLACLTHIRSRPWIEQMFARATRYDSQGPAYEQQAAYAYVPDDPLIMRIIRDLAEEQEPFIARHDQNVVRSSANPNENEDAAAPQFIVPCDSAVTRQRASVLSEDVDALSYEETQTIQAMMARHGVVGLSPVQLKRVLADAGVHLSNDASVGGDFKSGEVLPRPVVEGETMATASEREQRLRQAIQKHCNSVDRLRHWEHGTSNRLVLEQFGKSREMMTIEELTTVWQWLQRTQPRQRLPAFPRTRVYS